MNDRKRLEEDLPWLVNGTMPLAECKALTDALEAQPGLRAEREFFERLRVAVRDEPIDSPGEMGWRRLRRQIEAEPVTSRPAANQAWWRPVAMVATVLLAVQTLWVWAPWQTGGGYAPLGQTTQETAVDGVLLQVRPHAQASLGEWQALLMRINAEVVSGPGAAGIYRVVVPRSQAEAALAALKQAPGLVDSAALE
ncbi:MAG: hypothetical protein R3E42_05130 [Burkholderiaceae bacterium]